MTEVVLAGESLYAIPERGDRRIAATAQVYDGPLITRDPDIASAAAVPLIWQRGARRLVWTERGAEGVEITDDH